MFILRTLSGVYVTLFRGTPLFVQIFIWHFVWSVALINPNDGLLIGGDLAAELRRNHGALIAGVFALTVNAGAYITKFSAQAFSLLTRGKWKRRVHWG